MSGAVEQVFAEQFADIFEDFRIARGVESMAAVVEVKAIIFEAARVTADPVTLLENRNTG